LHNSPRRRSVQADGTTLIIVMLAATLLLVALTAVLPGVYQEGQREREEELIFRGTEYGKAVALFHRRFGRYPTNTKELIQTNGMRFLRKEYRNPTDPKGEWRFIHVDAAGTLLDSKNQQLAQDPNNPNSAGQEANPNSTNPPSEDSGQTSSSFGNSNDLIGGFIAGVAPTSHRASIRIWEKHKRYDQWEFLGIDLGIFGIQVGSPTPQPTPGGGYAPGAPPPPNAGSPQH